MQRNLFNMSALGLGLLLTAGISACGGGASVSQLPVTAAPVMDPAGNPPAADPAPDPGDKPGQAGSDQLPSYNFPVTVSDTSYKYGGSAESYSTTYSTYTGDWWWDQSGREHVPLIEVLVHVHNAQGLRMVFCTLGFDYSKLIPEYQAAGAALGDTPIVTVPNVVTVGSTGSARLGAMLVHPQDQAGFSGDGVVAKFYFRSGLIYPGAFADPPPVVPTAPDCSASLSYDAAAGVLRWGYLLPGDFDQNGRLNLEDWALLAANFDDPVTGLDSIEGVIHNAPTGKAWLTDIPIWGMHTPFGIQSYNVYRGSAAAYPDGGTLLGNVALSSATGDPAVERLRFSFPLAGPPTGQRYWVKPVQGGTAGIASNSVNF